VSDDYEEKYTHPELRRRLKDEILASDKGGRQGQWSARKAQLLVQRYEAEGGGYRRARDEEQRSLERWSAQDWQTVVGDGDADQDRGMRRYLPALAWAMLTDEEQAQAEQTKRETDDAGQQCAAWPEAVREAMTVLGETGEDPSDLTVDRLESFARQLDIRGRSRMTKDELLEAIRDADPDAA